jgi:hypothetical protein
LGNGVQRVKEEDMPIWEYMPELIEFRLRGSVDKWVDNIHAISGGCLELLWFKIRNTCYSLFLIFWYNCVCTRA